MSIKKIQVYNFKSFKNLEIDLNNLNVLIGANASGKSNFIEIFKFLRDITKHGLENAITMQGDIEYLRNINLNSSKSAFKIFIEGGGLLPVPIENNKGISISATDATYEFEIKFINDGKDFEVSKDEITYNCTFSEFDMANENIKVLKEFGSGKVKISNQNGKISIDPTFPKEIPESLKDDNFGYLFYNPLLGERFKSFASEISAICPRTLLINNPIISFPITPSVENEFKDISTFDFDPKLPRNAISFTGKKELEEDGSNLTIVLKNILKNKTKGKDFTKLINDVLPSVEEVSVAKFADKYLYLTLKEIYSNHNLPASLLSDGTLNTIALIVALYFNKKGLTVIEELERDIHPSLISRIMEMVVDASNKKQIIITTHSPELLKNVDLKEDILFISRDKDGFSQISRPSEKEEVKMFLNNEIGIEELFIQNLLGM